jgi:hypothetical protein
MKSWLRIMLVGLCVGAVVGPVLSTADAKTTPHRRPACAHPKAGAHKQAACAPKEVKPHKKAKAKPHKKGAGRPGGVPQSSCGYSVAWSPATWMDDIWPCLYGRKLSQIVIPGSHDSTTYSIDSPPLFVPYSKTQDEDLTSQLNGGIRQFDVRVLWFCHYPGVSCGYHARHGGGKTETISTYLLLPSILTSIDQWATAPGHEREVILLNLQIDQNTNGPFPTVDCQNFGATLGGSLVTPNELQAHFGTSDPGEVTLGQLWSLPDPKGAARVIMNNDQCMDAADPSAGHWGNYGGGYYADQCTADGDEYTGTNGNQDMGTKVLDLGAAQRRANKAGGGEPFGWGPPVVGLYELDLQVTPEPDCLIEPIWGLGADQEVLAALYDQFLTDPATRQNLNIVEEDFVDQTDLMDDAHTMDVYPVAPAAPTITGITNGDGKLTVAFSDTSSGTSGINSYQVEADSLDGSSVDIQHVSSSPVTLNLANGVGYVVTVTATSDDGTSPESAPSDPVYVGLPDPPTFATLICGDGQATVTFSETDNGVAPATSYTVSATDLHHRTAPPVSATGPSSPITVKGLTNADAYEFTLTATSADGTNSPSVSASACQVGVDPEVVSDPANGTVGQPYSSRFTVTGAPPPTVTLLSGDIPPGLTLGSDGKLTGTPTKAGSYTFTVKADNHLSSVERTATVTISSAVAPTAPTINGLTDGDGQVTVAFSGASAGTDPITSYKVSATDQNHPTAPPVTATGSSSPITVKGLTNGDPYVFTVAATSAGGSSAPSKPSGAINVGVAPTIVGGPANGTVGKPYSSAFTVTGAPAPTVTPVSGNVPGLTPGSDGSLTGTPTHAGSYELTVQATNPVGIYSASATIAIAPATFGAPAPGSGGRRVHATICTTEAGRKRVCAVGTLTGSFPPLEAGAAATLVRGTVTYAVGRASAGYRELTLTRRRRLPAVSSTLILRRPRRAMFVPVTVR